MSDIAALDFERAEFDAGAAVTTCAVCAEPLATDYYAVNGRPICGTCRDSVAQSLAAQGTSGRRVVLASVAGFGASLAGAVIYWAILAATGYEFGLIAIGVGYAVGWAVNWGSSGRGGWKYQALAMALTYFSIATAYVPLILREIAKEPASQAATVANGTAAHGAADSAAPQPAATSATSTEPRLTGARFVLILLGLAAAFLALPILSGFSNPIGLFIIAIGVYEAWKLNRRHAITIAGPFTLAPAAAATPAVAVD